jgi:hypothetical protein
MQPMPTRRLGPFPGHATFLCLAFAAGCGIQFPTPAPTITDSEITKLIVGKWNEPVRGQDFFHEFGQDGSYTGAAAPGPDGTSSLSFGGTWSVSGGVLIYTIQTSQPPTYDPGTQVSDRVLSITESEFRYADADGSESMMTRVTE